MSQPEIVAILDFETWFSVKQTSSGAWDCGEDTPDCAGARNMLCARNLTGNADYNRWWRFEDCLMSNQSAIPSNAAACATKNNIDKQQLSDCVNGQRGQQLLALSAQRTAEAKVVWTPWFGCEGLYPAPPPARPQEIDYLKVICDAYHQAGGSPMPRACSNSTGGAAPHVNSPFQIGV